LRQVSQKEVTTVAIAAPVATAKELQSESVFRKQVRIAIGIYFAHRLMHQHAGANYKIN